MLTKDMIIIIIITESYDMGMPVGVLFIRVGLSSKENEYK